MGNFETLESFGARSLKDFSWNELMAYDSCKIVVDVKRCAPHGIQESLYLLEK